MSGSWSIRIRIPAWTSGADDQRQRRRAERHHHPGQLRHRHPDLGRRRHRHRPAAHAGRHAGRQRQRQRRRGHLRPGGAVPATTATPTLSVAAGADRLVDHPDQQHRARVHRHRQRRPPSTSARSTTRRASTTPSTGTPTASSTGSGSYRLVNVGSGLVLGVQNMSTADGGLALQWGDTGTADHNWAGHHRRQRGPVPQRQQRQGPRRARTCPPPTTPASCSGPTTAPPTTAGPLLDNGDGTLQDPQRQQRQAARHPERLHRPGRPGRAGLRQRHRRQPVAARPQRLTSAPPGGLTGAVTRRPRR